MRFRLLSAVRFNCRKLPIIWRFHNAGRRWIHRGLIKRIPAIRIVVITKAECDRFLREQTDLAKVAA
jgi:hypothetical protein